MSDVQITETLKRWFADQRIVFWYDSNREFRAEFEALALPGVEKVELANNEFGVKYRVLRECPKAKFLLYREGPQPEPIDNWLLDVQLASGRQFRTDQAALWLTELGLGPNDRALVADHTGFFSDAKRRDALHKRLESGDSARQMRFKMLAVCAGSEQQHLDEVLEALLDELANGQDKRWKLVQRCGLAAFLWQQVAQMYGYQRDDPSLLDFAIELFDNSFLLATDGSAPASLLPEAQVFLRRWEDSRLHKQAFEALSARAAEVLGVHERLQTIAYRELRDLDCFEMIDRKVLSGLAGDLAAREITLETLRQVVRERRQSHWFDNFLNEYAALEHAAHLIHLLDSTALQVESLDDGIRKYADSCYRLDQRYRKFVYHRRQSGQNSLLNALAEQVDNLYSNTFLAPLNDAWQRHVDALDSWRVADTPLQRGFAQRFVQPYRERKITVCVLISDALRYEVGEELQSRIRREDKFDATLEPMLSMLPSYTQLGMAALLPNQSLALADSGDGNVLVDGQSAQGLANRQKILQGAIPGSAAVRATDLTAMDREATRALLRDHEVVYIYHNLIDKTGDTRDTEERVFAATEQTLEELTKIIKRLFNANASHVLVTADHGFLYQDPPLQESDFLSSKPEGREILFEDRRFVLGRGLREGASFKAFRSKQLGLDGDIEVLIPKSIHRLRRKGSGARFVHGGASLQEVVIPLLHVSKQRQSDIRRVEVDLIGASSKTITTGQLAVALYQREPVKDKCQPRRLRIGLYKLDGELISDQHELVFDVTSDDAREREQKLRLLLSRKADEANNQEVELRLEELLEGTSRYTTYKSARYTVRRSFTGDFDF